MLRPMREADLPRLAEIASEPEIARWWGELGQPELREKLEAGTAFAIEHDGELIGLAQWW